MSVSGVGSAGLGAYNPYATKKSGSSSAAKGTSATSSAANTVSEFLAYAHMNPAERLRAAYLKSHGLTEEELAAKSPEERQKIEDDIKREIEDKLKKETEDKVLKTNLLV